MLVSCGQNGDGGKAGGKYSQADTMAAIDTPFGHTSDYKWLYIIEK